ncbi:hypothetical protein BGX28_006422 [Mortierella sp. GBA30]|nr:hypothetical protein BGX28_006422 [Mortierella sp. GBA30]
MSISSLFSRDQTGSLQSRLPSQPKAARWANRGGMGGKTEMMEELETIGIFDPPNGQRLRAEFVYQTVTRCADEIRSRGLHHPNIFYNPAPRKVIMSMIELLTDRQRCNLYTIQCLRIDTVANLILNVLSQMSNPVIPYVVMEYYFQQGIPTSPNPSSPYTRTHSAVLRMGVENFSLSMLTGLPKIPALPFLIPNSSRATSPATIAWAREHFDLPAFLEALPLMNRVILLEILHICHELLGHSDKNRLTLTRLVHQFAPALFSTVFDQRIVEEVVGGAGQCSIHCDSISALDGTRAESHLFTVILVRFMHLTVSSNNSPRMTTLSTGNIPYEHHSMDSTALRKCQERVQQEHNAHYQKMTQSFQEMGIQQRYQQHFGQYNNISSQNQRQEHHYSSQDYTIHELDLNTTITTQSSPTYPCWFK